MKKKGGRKHRPCRGQTAAGCVPEAIARITMQRANRTRIRPKSSRLASRQNRAIFITPTPLRRATCAAIAPVPAAWRVPADFLAFGCHPQTTAAVSTTVRAARPKSSATLFPIDTGHRPDNPAPHVAAAINGISPHRSGDKNDTRLRGLKVHLMAMILTHDSG